ncbi:CHAT domain-containing protein [Streptomyces tendae]|uniref:CHAT domain-containing protein n=1 Tax=Streptomyces tendae TaxID=1932 RepID=A0ABX6A0R7_STRTE|nr:CHAT domain-containing protein [Streptomyces tendae]QER90532.1 CHAT domain-containing protein [Streptomyces tendae]
MAGGPEPDGASATDQRIALAHEWEELVARVRGLAPRFSTFLAPPRWQDLAATVGDGTGVLINVARECHALLVTSGGVTAVPLPDLSSGEVHDRTARHLARLHMTNAAAQLMHHTRQRAQVRKVYATYQAHHAAKVHMAEAQAELDRTLLPDLAWLWDTVAEPVLRALDETNPASGGRHRIWWCPTGWLSFLPLHAAGHHDGSGRSVLDRTVSSYVPTLRALARATRSPEPDPCDRDRLLVVAVQEAADMPPLPQVAEEVRLLREEFGAERLTVLEGPDATRDAVLSRLATHRWAHFSCHGRQDPFDPSRGGLLLSDGTLGIGELSRGSYRGDFAFLSACMTASGGLDLSDEAITIGAALHYSGFRRVVAALWSIDAETATVLARDVFRSLMKDGLFRPEGSAVAVTGAAIRLRHQSPEHPSRWATFTHIGP